MRGSSPSFVATGAARQHDQLLTDTIQEAWERWASEKNSAQLPRR